MEMPCPIGLPSLNCLSKRVVSRKSKKRIISVQRRSTSLASKIVAFWEVGSKDSKTPILRPDCATVKVRQCPDEQSPHLGLYYNQRGQGSVTFKNASAIGCIDTPAWTKRKSFLFIDRSPAPRTSESRQCTLRDEQSYMAEPDAWRAIGRAT